MVCQSCAHNEVCKYGEARSDGLYCTGTKCLQYLPMSKIIDCPCEVGQKVWFNRGDQIIETFVEKVVLKQGGVYLKLGCNAMYETSSRSIGKTVFLSESTAKQSLSKE